MLVNLERFRANGIADKCLEFLKAHPDAPFVDQEPLNYFCRGRIGLLSSKWGRFSWEAFRGGRPGCLHYVLDLPWQLMTNCYRDCNDAHLLWFAYADRLLGLQMEDVLVGGLKRNVLVQKLIWRFVFKMTSCVARMLPWLARTNLGDYCLRHYVTHETWRDMLDFDVTIGAERR